MSTFGRPGQQGFICLKEWELAQVNKVGLPGYRQSIVSSALKSLACKTPQIILAFKGFELSCGHLNGLGNICTAVTSQQAAESLPTQPGDSRGHEVTTGGLGTGRDTACDGGGPMRNFYT